jgi:glycine cleavage system H protein
VIPEDLMYSEEHEWIRVEDDIAVVGITDFAQEQLGDIVYVDLPAVGDEVSAGSVIGELESTKSVSDIFCPVDGSVIAVNDSLDGAPEVINSDPYGEGWIVKIRLAGDSATDGLLDSAAYAKIVQN